MKALIFLFLLIAPAAHAQDRMSKSLLKLEPATRLEQICDMEAMKQIRRDLKLKVDRAKSDVSETPVHKGHTVTAKGGAFRVKGKWYGLSFVCTGTSDHLRVISLNYKAGAEIPESKWEDLGLWR
jgi:hypothetical protein